jgi:RecJ-like exonuclease
LSRDVRRVAIYGAIGDYADDSNTVKMWCEDWDKRTLFFEAGALIQAIIYSGREFEFKRELIEHLAKDKLPSSHPDILDFARKCSDLEERLRLRIRKEVKSLQNIAYVIDPRGYKSKSAIYAAAYGHRKVGCSAEYRQTKHAYDISFRSRSPVDLNKILRDVAPRYEGSGGGLPEAAGARIPVRNFKAFLNELDSRIGEEERRLKEENIIDKCH